MLPLLIGAGLTLAGGFMKQRAVGRLEDGRKEAIDRLEDERRQRIALQDADILEARKTPQITTARGDLSALVADAERAGFNPLSVLRAGGLGMYSNTRHPNLFPIRGIETAATGQVAATGQSPMGDAFGSIGGMVSSFDYGAAARNQLEGQLMGAQIRNVQADTLARQSFRVPSVSYQTTPGGYSTTPGGAGQAGPLGLPSYDRWTEEVPTVTNPFFDWLETNPYLSDIETGAEARYGDFASVPLAIGNVVGDALWNVGRFGDYVQNTLGPQVRQGVMDWHSNLERAPDVPSNPYSITVGGPNQTGL